MRSNVEFDTTVFTRRACSRGFFVTEDEEALCASYRIWSRAVSYAWLAPS
jgi:hypothetical protein